MKQMSLQGRSVLGLSDFSESEIERILEMAGQMKSILSSGHKKTDLLRGKSVVNLFSEASTRTRSSFELAGKISGSRCD